VDGIPSGNEAPDTPRRFRRNAKWALAATTLVAAGLTGAVGLAAAASDESPVIYACVSTGRPGVGNDGDVRIVEGPGQCRSYESPISWNEQGEAGPTGLQGPAGPTGPQGPAGSAGSARAFAAVQPEDPHGVQFRDTVRGFGSVRVETVGIAGPLYCLIPSPDAGVTPFNSVLIVSLGNNGGGGVRGHAGHVGVCGSADEGFGWHVATTDHAGQPILDQPFTVMVP
jgi:hypothetical protein